MNLYIRIKDGQPFEHPILEENAHQAWPDVNFSLLPDWLGRFRRIPQPTPDVMPVSPYQRAVCSYTLAADGFWEDTWGVEDLSAGEIQVIKRNARNNAEAARQTSIADAITRRDESGIPAESSAVWETRRLALEAMGDLSQIEDPFAISWPDLPLFDPEGYPLVV